ncbi:unnamed protein product [Adineta ricciae]|uniref:Uncharacterized protein n=1 Tax=Adineta ricciae TaxID=249248 RepID=A0A814WLM6_ADIRI|nr:unnamed protein product [Adineta ricciae]
MDNTGATLPSQTSPNLGNPLNPLPIPPLASEAPSTTTIESIVSTPLEPVLSATEPVGQTNVDGNLQAHFDINYQAHDVALASATATTPSKNTEHPPKTGLQAPDHHKLDIDDSDDHLDKSKSCCSMLNKLLLALAIVCFALLLCSLAYNILVNVKGLNGKYDGRGWSRIHYSPIFGGDFPPSEQSISQEYFNISHPTNGGIIVVLARRGAAVHDVLIPYRDNNGTKHYRSVVVKGGEENNFGSVRFGFDDPKNSLDMTYQLPRDYPLLNAYKENWQMFADETKPYRVRFTRDLIHIVYEFSWSDSNQFFMTTMAAPASNEKLTVDPTNNIYFNLRSHGDLSTHNLNLSSSDPIEISNGQKMEPDRLIQAQPVNRLTNANNYFYKLDRAGIGKNYIATLTESETKTTMHVFSDHAGVRIDPLGVGVSNQGLNPATATPDMRGVRISPRQSPIYQSSSIYGPISVVSPSQAIHTTWWQFQYEN